MTELTDNNGDHAGDRIFFDGHCAMCRHLAGRLSPLVAPRGFSFEPLPVSSIPGSPDEMRLVTATRESFGGADAVVEIARRIWWAAPLVWFSKLPGGINLLRRGYRWIAARRHCMNGTCRTSGSTSPADWLPVLSLIFIVMIFRSFLSTWGFMWLMVAALFLGFKLATLLNSKRDGLYIGLETMLGYLLFWPGMDVRAYLAGADRAYNRALYARPLLRIAAGAGLFWGMARLLPLTWPLVVGWIGLLGLALMLHFGFLEILAITSSTPPIMREPLTSRSVSEFWGRRWNVAFPQMAYPLVYRPLRERFGSVGSTLVVFVFSGLLHELVISVPAGGGYGLPTGYFLVQGLAVLAERHWGAPTAVVFYQRLFAWVVVAGPAFWLFHPTFIERVILPMMRALGAL